MASAAHVGVRGSMFNLLGLEVGLLFVLAAVATGLGAVLVASAATFAVLKWLGVGYIVYLGIRQLRASDTISQVAAQGDATIMSRRGFVLQGFLVNASNPKGIVFMLTVLPQFIDPDQRQLPQYLLCAVTLLVTDIVVMNGYALFASRMLRVLRSPRRSRWLNRIFGGMHLGAAGLLAAFGRHS